MFNKFEIFGAAFCVLSMAVALYLVQLETSFDTINLEQSAQVITAEQGVVIVEQSDDVALARALAYREASDNRGNINRMVIDDIKIGTGPVVKEGDVVSVHYAGTLQGGQEFDNSKKRGQPFEFTVGGGQVIKGWEEGLIGMQVGGERVLVIPPEKAYGEQGVGPIPGGATLIFSIELLEIK